MALVLGGCGGADSGAKAAGAAVELKLIAFKPDRLTVKAGTAVTWRNADGVDHTVTSGTVVQEGGVVRETPDGTFESGVLAGGKTFAFTFPTKGTFAYFCKIHPATMRGEITVN